MTPETLGVRHISIEENIFRAQIDYLAGATPCLYQDADYQKELWQEAVEPAFDKDF